MRKIVIMVPNDQAEAIENIRRRQHISRSRVIQQAVARYLKEEKESEAVRAYVEGYRRKPERAADVEALAKATAETMEAEDWS